MKDQKVINTQKILEGTFGLSSEKLEANILYQKKSPPSSTMTESELNEEFVYKNQTSQEEYEQSYVPTIDGIDVTSPAPVKKEKTASGEGQSDKPLYETRPSKFKMSKYGYLSPKNNPKRRKLSKVSGIYLHHTANLGRKDKGKATFEGWYNNDSPTDGTWSANAHVVIDENGHIEYGIPYEYMCITQGNQQTLNYEFTNKFNKKIGKKEFKYANSYGLGCEVENFGYFNEEETRGGVTYWKRKGSKWYSELKYDIVKLLDFDGKPITFKMQKRGMEFPQVQCDAIEKWLREVLELTGINWKFNKDTYKQMFPNMGRRKFFDKGKNDPNYKKSVFIEKDDLYLIGSGGSTGRWAISKDANEGVRGVYTHSSVYSGKIDLLPTPNIIKMLKKFS